MTAAGTPDFVLASTSRYRQELLGRVLGQFRTCAPVADETPHPGEPPAALAQRLAEAKAQQVAQRNPEAVVIGSDQVADLDGKILGKPGNLDRARAQLSASSGHEVAFHTAVCVIDGRNAPSRKLTATDLTRVRFRSLEDAEITRYLEREQPFDCAGSFKSEGAGIALFERIDTKDPTALIGLPLIALCRLLRDAGIPLP